MANCFLELPDNQPDVAFVHINNLVNSELDIRPEYINNCTERGIMIIIYSGGDVEYFKHASTQDTWVLQQGKNEWHVKAADCLCVVPRPVYGEGDLNLMKALELLPDSASEFLRQIRVKNMLLEDMTTLQSDLLNDKCWQDEKERLKNLSANVCRYSQHEPPEAFWAQFAGPPGKRGLCRSFETVLP